MHSRNPGFRSGDYWVVCDRCGFDYRNSQIKVQWDGLTVCNRCWEPRHPQDFVRAVKDTIAPQGPVRTPPTETFVTGTEATTGEPQGLPRPSHPPPQNQWSTANVVGTAQTPVTASGLDQNNFLLGVGVNICQWQGADASGKTHELIITPITAAGDIRVVRISDETSTILTATLTNAVANTLIIRVPSDEDGWLIESNQVGFPTGSWACTLYIY